MENSQNNIDQFYSDKLSGHQEYLSKDSWGRMKWRLFWLDLRNYVIAFAALILLGTVAYFGFFTTGQPDESRMESLVFIEETANTTEANQANEPIEITALVAETSMSTQITESIFPATESTATLMATSMQETKLPAIEPENTEDAGTDFKESGSVHFYSLSFIETRNNYPALLLNKEKSPAEEMIIDSISYPYHDIRKRSWISISLYAAPAYTTSTLSADQSFDDYLNYRNSHESGTISWSAGADVQLNIRNWYIQTGLSYSTYSDNRNYNYTFKAIDSLQSYFTNDTTWGWVYDPPDIGKPIVLSVDSTFVPVYNEINEGINQWKYLEIPILVGYTFHANRFSIDIGTGFSYGLLLSASGNLPSLTEENLFIDLSGLESQMKRHNFNYIIQIGAAYHLTPQWSLVFQPYYKQNLRSVFENNYPVDQRFKAFSIKFGLKVDL